MDSLITILSTQSQKQDSQINELKNLQLIAFETSGKISNQITATKFQTDYIQNSQEPKVVIMGGAFIKILEDKYQIQQTIKNLGLREAKNSRATMYIMKLLDTGIHLQLHTPPSTSKSGATSIGPNESIPIYVCCFFDSSRSIGVIHLPPP